MEENKQFQKKLWIGSTVYAFIIVGILVIANINAVNAWLMDAILLFRPVINGLIIAYLCNPFFRFFERKLFCRLNPPKLRRALSLLCAFLVILGIIALILLIILPQLIDSVLELFTNYDSYVSSAIRQGNKSIEALNGFLERFTNDPNFISTIDETKWQESLSKFMAEHSTELMTYLTNIDVNGIISTMSEVVGVVTDLIFGLFVAIYLLASKEKRVAQMTKLRRALFGEAANERISKTVKIANHTFGDFVRGKLMDSTIMTAILFVLMTIFNIPYAALLSATIGIFNLVPLIGSVVGAFPTAFILLLTAPDKLVPYLLILVAVILLDNNVIAPRILGSNTGISSLCVMIAISTMGNLWGLAGVLLGVPLFATILELAEISIIERLQKKGRPSGLANYYAPDTEVDPLVDVQNPGARIRKSIHKRLLLVLLKLEQDPMAQLSFGERLLYRTYRMARKIHLATDFSAELLTQLAVEEELKKAHAAAEQEFERLTRQEASADAPTQDSSC